MGEKRQNFEGGEAKKATAAADALSYIFVNLMHNQRVMYCLRHASLAAAAYALRWRVLRRLQLDTMSLFHALYIISMS